MFEDLHSDPELISAQILQVYMHETIQSDGDIEWVLSIRLKQDTNDMYIERED